jgi:hypothetical protein
MSARHTLMLDDSHFDIVGTGYQESDRPYPWATRTGVCEHSASYQTLLELK